MNSYLLEPLIWDHEDNYSWNYCTLENYSQCIKREWARKREWEKNKLLDRPITDSNLKFTPKDLELKPNLITGDIEIVKNIC